MTTPYKKYRAKRTQDVKSIFMNDFNILKYNREKAGYTQAEFAKKLGCDIRTVQRIERMNIEDKVNGISLRSLLSYLDELGLSLTIKK